MTRRAVHAARIAIVALALLLLVPATGFAAPASAATEPPARKLGEETPQESHTRPACRSDREPSHRHPVPLGRRLAGGRLRLLRPRPVRVQPARDRPPPQLPRLSTGMGAGSRVAHCAPATSSSSRGSGMSDLRRRGQVHPRAPARHHRPLVAPLLARELLRRAAPPRGLTHQSGLQPLPLRAAKICRWWAFACRSARRVEGTGGAVLPHHVRGDAGPDHGRPVVRPFPAGREPCG